MKRTALILLLALCSSSLFSQGELKVIVKDSIDQGTLPGVGIQVMNTNTKIAAVTDINGSAIFKGLSSSKYVLRISYVGYRTKDVKFSFISGIDLKINVSLVPEAQMIDEVVISTTRTNSHVDDQPLKVEVIGQDDTEEENGIKPGNVSSLLGDVSGIQIQQTSATSGNANVRIQGLAGKYTQVLRDGIPMYEGFSADFGVLQLPPLDLKQIEIVKGSASTLYGGGAIAGIINLISKDPSPTRDASITMNYSSLGERNFNTFISQRTGRSGYTFFSGFTNQDEVDVNKDGFSDVPRLNYVSLHPKFYHYFKNESRLVIGVTGVFEKRDGGDMFVLSNRADSMHRFFETDKTFRDNIDIDYSSTSKKKNVLHLKASAGYFDHSTNTSNYLFSGIQYNLFGEISYLIPREKYDLVFGVNYIGDRFLTDHPVAAYIRAISNNTVGGFVQHTLRIKEKLILESGLRLDAHDLYGTFILPRLALLYKINKQFSTRANAGLGYKTPSPFTKQFEEYDPTKIFPLSDSIKAENSFGTGFELVYKKVFENGLSIFADQSFFYNEVDRPVIPVISNSDEVHYINADKPVVCYGSDTYIRVSMDPFEVYLGYTYTHAEQQYDTIVTTMPLYPVHRFATVISYEPNAQWRFGVESSYFGSQFTPDGAKKPGYLFVAAMIGRNIGNISIVLNCENVLDYRQQKVEEIVLPPYSNPVFKPLWAPIDGRVLNLSVRLKF